MWKQRPYDKAKEQELIQCGYHKMLARLIAQRNVAAVDVDVFLSAKYNDLSHPFSLHDVEKAVEIFLEVVNNKGSVASWGDYDVDGILSSVMLMELCKTFGVECNCLLPSRLDHGYGLNHRSLEEIKNKNKDKKINLLFVLDCGTNSVKEIEELKSLFGCKIIIIDHHSVNKDAVNNADAIISWHLGGNCEMCTCGEMFQFIRGVRWFTKKVNPIEYLSLSAIGTIADCSPIIGDNRIIVKNGLTEYALNNVVASGLTALLKQSRINSSSVTQEDISFQIAPKINAVGRMFHPDLVFGLMVERDMASADKMAGYILAYNDERKDVQKQIEIEAKAIVEMGNGSFSHGILISNDQWHIGVVGIVAARLVDLYKKPSIVVGKHNGVWKGSGRTIPGVNLKEILDECPEIFETYGGHASAAGVTLKINCLKKANKIFNKACKTIYDRHHITEDPIQYYDGKLTVDAITPKTAKVLCQHLYPYCDENNNEPIFMLSNAIITDISFLDKNKGWRLMKFNVEKNGTKIPYTFKTFHALCGTEMEGKKVNIMFSFPQRLPNSSMPYSKFELTVVDIIPC